MKSKTPDRESPRELAPSPSLALGLDEAGCDGASLLDGLGAFGNSMAMGIFRSFAGTPGGEDPSAAFADATRGGGSGIPYQQDMESAFGQDFSGVKAHFGQEGPMSAIGARAAASGERVVFGENNPDRRVVAHELAHVVQQRNVGARGVQGFTGLSRPGDASEREADAVAERVASGGRAGALSAVGTGLHRLPIDAPTPQNRLAAETWLGNGKTFAQKPIKPDIQLGTGGEKMGSFKAGLVIPQDGHGTLTVTADTKIHFLDAPGKVWTQAEKDAWKSNFATSMASVWGGKFSFHVHQTGWNWIGTGVEVKVNVAETATAPLQVPASGPAPTPSDDQKADMDASDFVTSVSKDPVGACVWNPGKDGDKDSRQIMYLREQAIEGYKTWGSRMPLKFPKNDGTNSADLLDPTYNAFIARFKGDQVSVRDPLPVTLEGFAGADETGLAPAAPAPAGPAPAAPAPAGPAPAAPAPAGPAPAAPAPADPAQIAALVDKRMQTVKADLAGKGWMGTVSTVDKGAQAASGAAEQRVDVVPPATVTDKFPTAAHEFGHAVFGLGDRYSTKNNDATGSGTGITGTGDTTGKETLQSKYVARMRDENGDLLKPPDPRNPTAAPATPAPTQAYENNESVMALGNKVTYEDYATIYFALEELTKADTALPQLWSKGAPVDKIPTIDGNPQEMKDKAGNETTSHQDPTLSMGTSDSATAKNASPFKGSTADMSSEERKVKVLRGRDNPIKDAKSPPAEATLFQVAEGGAEVKDTFGSIANPCVEEEIKPETMYVGGKPSVEDVRQGGIGDCFFQAALISVLSSDPGRIQSMMSLSGKTVSTLFWFKKADGSWQDVRVSQNLQLAVNQGSGTLQGASFRVAENASRSDWFAETAGTTLFIERADFYECALWAPYLEKAYARFAELHGRYGEQDLAAPADGGYNVIDQGGTGCDVMGIFYGPRMKSSGQSAMNYTPGANNVVGNQDAILKLLMLKGQGLNTGETANITAVIGNDDLIERTMATIDRISGDRGSFKYPSLRRDMLYIRQLLLNWQKAIASGAADVEDRQQAVAKATQNASRPDAWPLLRMESAPQDYKDLLELYLDLANLGAIQGRRNIFSHHIYSVVDVALLDTNGAPLAVTPANIGAEISKIDGAKSYVVIRNPHHGNEPDRDGKTKATDADNEGRFNLNLNQFFRNFSAIDTGIVKAPGAA
jgi:hypothetical protein